MAGYSKTPLIKKLGIKENSKVIFINPPSSYLKNLNLPKNVEIKNKLEKNLDFVQFFTKSKTELKKEFPFLKKSLAQDGVLWICWPKKSAKTETDLDENIVMRIGLQNGLVDIKVCAIDETWSGLKFVFRLRGRKIV